uniref:Arrestin domain containing 2 n=1 Tax=Neogobius melanostomus TaxID=47308 RepID=A0A8C6SJ36_9GOBI
MSLSSIKSFRVDLDGPVDAAFTRGELVSGRVLLEVRRETRVLSIKVQGRGVATAHWLENRGMNSVYNDYTSRISYFRRRQHLIRGTVLVQARVTSIHSLQCNQAECHRRSCTSDELSAAELHTFKWDIYPVFESSQVLLQMCITFL